MQFEDMNARDMHRPYKKLLGRWKLVHLLLVREATEYPESNPSARNQWTRTKTNLNSILHNCLRLFPGLGSLHDEDCASPRYIQRIDEMERIIRFLLEELTKADLRQSSVLGKTLQFGQTSRSYLGVRGTEETQTDMFWLHVFQDQHVGSRV